MCYSVILNCSETVSFEFETCSAHIFSHYKKTRSDLLCRHVFVLDGVVVLSFQNSTMLSWSSPMTSWWGGLESSLPAVSILSSHSDACSRSVCLTCWSWCCRCADVSWVAVLSGVLVSCGWCRVQWISACVSSWHSDRLRLDLQQCQSHLFPRWAQSMCQASVSA